MDNYYSPTLHKSAFTCPQCAVYSNQVWYGVLIEHPNYTGSTRYNDLFIVICNHCKEPTFWYKGQLVFPAISAIQKPVNDMPDDVKRDYLEAREIVLKSPRAAVALLRLALQKLMLHLGEKGDNLNEDIKNLVSKGLPVKIQQALDTVRVIGNNAVHPGEINIQDNPEIASTLFSLLNIIVEVMITQSKEIEKLYSNLPAGAISAIERRDS